MKVSCKTSSASATEHAITDAHELWTQRLETLRYIVVADACHQTAAWTAALLMQLAHPLICERANLYQFGEAGVEAGVDGGRGAEPGLHERRGCGEETDFVSHDWHPSVGSDIMT